MSTIKIIPNVRTLDFSMDENNSNFLCPTNTVMTGRYHSGDENGLTQYEYATLKAVDEHGNAVSGTITVEDVQWSAAISESSGSGFEAPTNRVIVGRQHSGDENGNTKYATAVVKFNGTAAFVGSITQSSPIKESDGRWFKTDSQRVITGRRHSGDENGNTIYYSGIITTTLAPVKEIKVVVYMDPSEDHFPMDPMQFIKESRFRRHNSGKKDDGYSKVKGDFVIGNDDHTAEFYDIPVSVINSHHTNNIHTNVRPRDDNNDPNYDQVFLQPDDHPVGNRNPTGAVPVFVYSSKFMENGEEHERREYWLFYGYNGTTFAAHQGDWERVTLNVYDGRIIGAWLDQHGDSKYYPKAELEVSEISGVQTLTVYSSNGSHATNPSGSKGVRWEITQKVEKLEDQPWKLYAGAWGEVGVIPAATGPLGPWYKRMDI